MALGARFVEVLEGARAGADWAWEAVYRDLSPSVLGYLRARGAAEPDDLLGEVFLQLVRDLGSFRGTESDFRAWAFTVAHHRLLDDRRRRARRPAGPVAEPAVAEAAGASAPGADDEALDALAAARVRQVIARLSPDQQTVLLLRIVGDLTVEQVAHAIGKRPGAVKALQRRGLAAVKKELSEEGVPL